MAAEGSDNPILDMGLLGMMQPNPYIDPQFAGKPLKLPGFYTGQAGAMPPTDAYGKPIQSFVDANNTAQTNYQNQLAAFNANKPPPGTTLNSTPLGIGSGGQPAGGTIDYSKMGSAGAPLQELMSNYQAAQAKLTPQQQYNQQQSQAVRDQNLQQQNMMSAARAGGGGFGNMAGGAFNPGQTYTPTMMGQGGGGGVPAAAGPTPPTPPDMRQAYLDALSNPEPPTRVGAAVPASTPLGTPSVLNAFMAAHPSGGAKGAGGYDNSGFFNTLSNLRNA